jgi:hypothetical protein
MNSDISRMEALSLKSRVELARKYHLVDNKTNKKLQSLVELTKEL